MYILALNNPLKMIGRITVNLLYYTTLVSDEAHKKGYRLQRYIWTELSFKCKHFHSIIHININQY